MKDSIALTLIQTLFVLAAVIALANISLKLIGKKLQGRGRAIQVLEKLQVSTGSSLAVVRIMEDYYLMSLSEHGNTIVKELKEEELTQYLDRQGESLPVQDMRGFAAGIIEKRKTK
ncbi:flagellar biosynthetic protein FliO [Gudongella oleilytica]|jgi:flagellar biogenesis protein FliO|uniref:flagellar biosynthetic protein FliO n=1 Tax=Gudongella oleilytica TaxID=1582259 RepID=UPI002A35F80A|nr:flagellar biosynthetic protein FliO [Gudongella oleilytica]MDY0256567.1 flagellar biosynthetic protein FliO [Gudongella oleilytica]HMM68984.1 flagellar biosynthetic protein FliO [Gudongella oleilytica]